MLRSFRIRLLAGFAVVILITLIISALGFLLLLRQQQTEAAEQRIGLLVEPIARYVREMEIRGQPRELMRYDLERVARYYDIRIMILDAFDRVLLDTHPERRLVGKQLAMPTASPTPNEGEQGGMSSFHAIRLNTGGEDLYLFTPTWEDWNGWLLAGGTRLVIAVPAEDVTSAWAALLPRLLLAGGTAGLLAVVVASLLASRITNPIAQMTRASEAMAGGNLDQGVEGEGDDEIGTLARAFNLMSARVSRSNRAMRDLVANVSHELKTPLTSIQGFSQAMLDGMARTPEEYTEMAGAIHEETARIRVLVDDLLYLSEIESGTLQLNLEWVDLDGIAEETARRFRYQAEEAQVSVLLEPGAGEVRADGRRLEQVLANLVDNALRFAPEGTEVAVRASRSDGWAQVEVSNGGEPIPADHLPYLFDRFYQADAARSGARANGAPEGRHAGLGLAIVRELAQAHGGDVSVESSAEAGTVFRVRLPVEGPAAGMRS